MRASALVLLLTYVTLSVGILKATHFCMGREASVVYFTTESKKCPCSEYAGEKNGCCDDEHELLRIDDEQKVITHLSVPSPEWKLEQVLSEQFVSLNDYVTQLQSFIPDVGLPDPVPLWKSHCSLVFYDDERLVA